MRKAFSNRTRPNKLEKRLEKHEQKGLSPVETAQSIDSADNNAHSNTLLQARVVMDLIYLVCSILHSFIVRSKINEN